MTSRWFFILLGILGDNIARAQINVYLFDLVPSPVVLSDDCISAINATINCDSAITAVAFQDYYGSLSNSTIQDSVCAGTCSSAISGHRQNVLSICGSDAEMDSGYPVTYVGDLIWAYTT